MEDSSPPPGAPRAILPDDEDHVVMHHEFQAIIDDVTSGRDGLGVLTELLLAGEFNDAIPNLSAGVAALLDGLRTRLDMACDNLNATAVQLGMDPSS